MRTRGDCAAERHCSPARRLLGGGLGPSTALPAPSVTSLDAQRARLERVLCATTAVLFAASVSYVVFSTVFACFRAAGRPQRPDAEPPAASTAAVETTKRALQEIPVVVVVQVREDPAGGRSREGGAEEEDEAMGDGDCAVCLAEYVSGEEVRVLPACRHGFHRECVDRWLLTRVPTCPVCREPVVAASSEGRDAKGCATGGTMLPVVP